MSLLAVVGLGPTTVKASESYSGGFAQYFEYKWRGEWLYHTHVPNDYYGSSMAFEMQDRFDHEDINARVMGQFNDVDFEQGRITQFDYKFRLSAQDTAYENLGVDSILNAYAYGSVDGVSSFVPINASIDWYYEGDYLHVTVVYYGAVPLKNLRVYLEFNVYNAFGSSPFVNALGNFYFAIPENSSYISDYVGSSGIKPPTNIVVPEWNGGPDINGLPSIDSFIPTSGNPLMVTLSYFTNLPVVVNCLLIVSVVGVLAYVVFGKRP